MIDELIERVEKGEGRDRRLDYEIATGIVGVTMWDPDKGNLYTTSLDDVLALIEEKLPGWGWSIEDAGCRRYEDNLFASPTGRRMRTANASSPARALLAVALRNFVKACGRQTEFSFRTGEKICLRFQDEGSEGTC